MGTRPRDETNMTKRHKDKIPPMPPVILPIKTVRVDSGRVCPYCGAKMECTSTTDLRQVQPEPGNLAVCFMCMGVCVFETNGALRRMTGEELAALMLKPEWDIVRGVMRANEILKLLLGLEEE